MKLLGMMSVYREGSLAVEAVRSLTPHVDDTIVYEGPCGPDRCDDAPATDYTIQTIYNGSWQTDAEKLTAMTAHAKKHAGPREPLWGLWLSGDELLVNGHLLRDLLQRVQWEDERLGRSIADPDNGPTFSVPLTQVEHDGSLARVLSRCVRLDLIRRYVVSSHVIELVNGQTIQHGLRPLTFDDTPQAMTMTLLEHDPDLTLEEKGERMQRLADRLFVPTLLAGEPYTIHRSHLRHPARQMLRMHDQEAAELERHGLPR